MLIQDSEYFAFFKKTLNIKPRKKRIYSNMTYKPYAVPSWCDGTSSDTIGHSAVAKIANETANIITGMNEFRNVNNMRTWEMIARTQELITHMVLWPVRSTNIPKTGDMTVVTKKNKLKILKL